MKKSIPKVRERESEASILGNDREREFPLTPGTDALHQISKDIINYRHRNIFVRRFKLLPKHTCELFDVCLTSGFTLQCDSLIRWHDGLQVSDDRLLSEQGDQGQAFDLTDSLDKRKVTFRLWADGK